MSYEVIARKWRPQTFSDLVGQHHVTQTLLNALKSQRLPHALLFTGSRGVGKTSAARILAKSLRCPNSVDFNPCNTCSDCKEVSSGKSVDVLEIDGASNNGVDAIRELIEKVGYMPASGKKKVYIIDEVHMLSISAFNALLKTLEEPPEHVTFIFATTEAQKIPNTILSRCQRFDFRRIPTKVIANQLETICKKEKIPTDKESLWMIARQGDGSMRDSQSLLDQVITFSQQELTRDKTIEVLGLTDRRLVLETLESLINRDTQKVVQIIQSIFEAGYDTKIFIEDILEELRHLAFIKSSKKVDYNHIDLPDSEISELEKLGQNLTQEDVHLLFDMALKGEQDLLKAQNARIVLEMVLLRMSAAPRVQNLLNSNALVKKNNNTTVTHLSSNNSNIATKAVAPESTKKPENMSSTLSKPPYADWSAYVNYTKKSNPLLGAKLEHVAWIGKKDNLIRLGIKKQQSFLLKQLSTPEAIKKLEQSISDAWEKSIKVELEEISEDKPSSSPAEIAKQAETDKKNKIRLEVESHPTIQATQKTFHAEIKNIKELT